MSQGNSTFRNQCGLLAAAILLLAVLAGPTAAVAADGQELFVSAKCNNCHSIEKYDIERKIPSEKTKGPDQGDVGDRHDAAWIVQYVMKEIDFNDKKHLNNFKGSKKDLETIAAWLAEQKSG
jgi:cytochrome c2